MEHEEFTSQFRPLAGEKLIPAEDKFSASRRSTGYSHPSRGEQLLSEFSTRIYNQLNTWEGMSGLLHYSEEDSVLAPFKNILGFLKEQGIVSHLRGLDDRYNDAPAFSRFGIESMYHEYSTDGRKFSNSRGYGGYSFDRNMEVAISKAIGEFLERYFLTIYRKKDFIRGSYNFMKKNGYSVIQPGTFAGFSDEQKNYYPYFRQHQESVFNWQGVKRVLGGKEIFIPAQYVFWNYIFEKEEPRLVDLNTNGGGGMFSVDGAILSALYEIIQRDGFLIYWMSTLTPLKVNPASVPDDMFQLIFQESCRYGFRIHCLNTTVDSGVPSFTVVVEDPAGCPRFSLGSCCDANPTKAIRHALEEAWAVYYFLRNKPVYTLPESYVPFRTESISRVERLRLWANSEMADKYSFLISGEEKKFSEINFTFPAQFSNEHEELRCLVEQIESLGPGYEVYYYAAENPVLSHLNYHVVKAVVPQMMPFYLNETFAPLGAARLREVPQKLGYQSTRSINPWPHPFP